MLEAGRVLLAPRPPPASGATTGPVPSWERRLVPGHRGSGRQRRPEQPCPTLRRVLRVPARALLQDLTTLGYSVREEAPGWFNTENSVWLH